MITVERLGFSRAGRLRPVLSDISFQLAPGGLLLLCGRNGAGKSTLLRILAGLLIPDSGVLDCAGTRWPAKAGGPRRSALLLQEAEHQILGATVMEDILLPWPRPDAEQRCRAAALASAYGLGALLDAETATLSYGQKRKLCIVSALMTDPEVLLLDEPSCGLDYPSCLGLVDSVRDVRSRGISAVIATHDPGLFLPCMEADDRMLLLHEGTCAFCGPAAEAAAVIRRHPELGIRPCLLP